MATAYLPLHSGARFSANARWPSLASSDVNTLAKCGLVLPRLRLGHPLRRLDDALLAETDRGVAGDPLGQLHGGVDRLARFGEPRHQADQQASWAEMDPPSAISMAFM